MNTTVIDWPVDISESSEALVEGSTSRLEASSSNLTATDKLSPPVEPNGPNEVERTQAEAQRLQNQYALQNLQMQRELAWRQQQMGLERQRMVFTLCQVDDQTPVEVSEALGLSEATVRVHLFRAIRKLRTMLERGR